MAHNLVTLDGGVDDLANEFGVSSSYTESVLLGVVLVLILLDKSSSGVEVGLSLSSASELDLESLVVGSSLKDLDECHCVYI
mgnify:CR=1 FL=1